MAAIYISSCVHVQWARALLETGDPIEGKGGGAGYQVNPSP